MKTIHIIKLASAAGFILLFSYPAFSHDIFNYIFDSRILITHRVNPWQNTALDFPSDLWTRFMRWTHRTYPYGPGWLLITAPFYLIGMGKFSLTLFFFKLIGFLSYLASIYFIFKILKIINNKSLDFSLALFAFNPLVLIESLISAHIDIAMTAFFLAAVYLVLLRKKYLSWLLLLFSGLIKFVSLAAFPVFIIWRGEKEKFSQVSKLALLSLTFATLLAIITHEILPWYFILPISVVSLIPQSSSLQKLSLVVSLSLLLRYAPYLYIGEYTDWVKNTRNLLTILPLMLYAIFFLIPKNIQEIRSE